MPEYITRTEQETIINFNEQEKFADVYTHNSKLKHRLEGLATKNSSKVVLRRTDGKSATFSVPKEWIRINPPRTVNLSAERREALAARAAANFYKDR